MKNNVIFVNFKTGETTETPASHIFTNGEIDDMVARMNELYRLVSLNPVDRLDLRAVFLAEIGTLREILGSHNYEVLRIQNERSQLELEGKRLKNLPLKLVA